MAKKSNSAPRPSRTPQGKDFHIELLNTAQKMAWQAFQQHDVLFLTGPAGTGKAQPLSAKIMTPSGYKLMADIHVGDMVSTPDGNSAKVSGVFPQGKKPIYRIVFHDGTSTECCDEHLWEVSSTSDELKSKIVDTKYIRENCLHDNNRRKYYIAATAPVQHNRQTYLIPPYTMGLFLGSKQFNKNTTNQEVNKNYQSRQNSKSEYVCVENKKTEQLDHYGLSEHKSKFIPKEYLFGAVDQRIQLLQGLMDSGGRKQTIFNTSSPQLADDFCHLVHSLGGIAKTKIKETANSHSYTISVYLPGDINILTSSRKLRLRKGVIRRSLRRYIDRVEYVGEKEAQCIYIDDNKHLYLTDNYIVTHNTFMATAFAVKTFLSKECSKIVITRPIVEAGESLGYLPGDFEEKVNPYMMPMYDCMDKLLGREGPHREKVLHGTEVAPIAYMRGRAIVNTEMIPTPTGMKQMGEIQVGDFVIGSDGKPTEVVGVYPQGVKPVYEVTFSDHTKSVCSGDHLWTTMTLSEKRNQEGYTVKNTIEIMETVKNKRNQKVHRVPTVSGPVQFDHEEVPIDPYLLGVLLGNDDHVSKCLSITTSDHQIVDECLKVIPKEHEIVYRGKCDYNIQSKNEHNRIQKRLIELEIWEKSSCEKFVPDVYKFNDPEVRLAFLQGLMDKKGLICKHQSGNVRIQFHSESKKMTEDVMFIVRSLGGLAYSRTRQCDENNIHVVDIMMNLNPFRLERKAIQYKNNQKIKRMISSIDPVGEAECTCIKVDANDSLFLTNDFLVTHNTFDNAVCIFDEAQNASMKQLKLFLTRFGENSKIIITGDPSQSDLPGPVALSEVIRRLSDITGVGVVEFKANSIVRHPLIAKIVEKLGD